MDDTGKPTIRKGLNGPGKFEEHIKSRSSEDYSIIYKANKAAIEETAKESYLRSKHRRKDDAHTHQMKHMMRQRFVLGFTNFSLLDEDILYSRVMLNKLPAID